MDLIVFLAAYVIVVLIIVVKQWRTNAGVGLSLAYLMHLGVNHWFGALTASFPWYWHPESAVTQEGFRLCTYGILGFVAGSMFAAPFSIRFIERKLLRAGDTFYAHRELWFVYLAIGLVFTYVLGPLIGHLPTIGAVLSVGGALTVVALCLFAWRAWLQQKVIHLIICLCVALVYPFFSMLRSGFLGYGAVAFLILFSFVASFYRPRWKVIVCALLLGYLGLSFYVNYIRDRGEIREMVWEGEPWSARITRLAQTFRDFEWFDPQNEEHLTRINQRLNQNALVGSAMLYIDSGYKSLAYGETIWRALLALIPRAIWPGKPMVAGSEGIVSEYTGIVFAEGTSVGVGHVMEFYINFGVLGVVIGFLALGWILTVLDALMRRLLEQGDWQKFAMFYLGSLGFLQVGGSLVELTTSVASGFVLAYLLNRFVLRKFKGIKFPNGEALTHRRKAFQHAHTGPIVIRPDENEYWNMRNSRNKRLK